MKKGIIFDLDGTLWDACEAIAASWNLYLERSARDALRVFSGDDLRAVCGLTMKKIGDTLFSDIEEKRRDEITEGCCEFEVEYLSVPREGVEVVKGLGEVLTELKKKGYHLYIVSNCQKGYIEDFLINSGLGELFEDWECFGNTGKEKDFNIRLLADRNGLDQALYVGDTQGDYDSAMEAGTLFVHAAYGYGQVDAPVRAIADILQLPAAAEELLEQRM